MTEDYPYKNLPQALLGARESLLRHFRPILTHYGLTDQQWRILRALDSARELEPREICDICQILSPSMAGVLARMEELGLVSRQRMKADQRRVRVRLTAQAQTLVDEIRPLIMAQYQLIEQAFGRALLDALYAAADKAMAIDPAKILQVPLPERPAKKRPRDA